MKHSIAIREHLHMLSEEYELDTSHILNQIAGYEEYLFIKSELETVVCKEDFSFARKTRGLLRYKYAQDYLIMALAEEIKRITGEPNYMIVEECLQFHKINISKEDLPQIIKRKRPLFFHIQQVLDYHKATLQAYIKT